MARLAAYQASLPVIKLDAGQIHMGRRPVLVSTILGSCVSVCLFDPATSLGAICHGALPHARHDVTHEPFRYVDEAVFYLMDRYRRLGVSPRTLVAKVFGGSDVLSIAEYEGHRSIGRQNTMAALETLAWYRVEPSVQEAGGATGRRLYFVPHTGEAFVKRLKSGSLDGGCG